MVEGKKEKAQLRDKKLMRSKQKQINTCKQTILPNYKYSTVLILTKILSYCIIEIFQFIAALTYMLIIYDYSLVACGLVRANVLVDAPVTSPATGHTPYTSAE